MTLRAPAKDGVPLTADWRFEELFSDDADADGVTLLSLMDRFGLVLLPKDERTVQPWRQFSAVDAALTLTAPAITSLAVRARAPSFLRAFWDARYARRGDGTRTVGGTTLHVRALAQYSKRDVMPLGVSLAEVEAAVGTVGPLHEAFVALADARFFDGDLGGACTNVATAMEIAAYALGRSESGAEPKGRFAPKKYFAAVGDAPANIKAYVVRVGIMAQPTLGPLDSLWGTRNEIVHNGVFNVRPPRPLQPGVVRDDYYEFRAALSRGLVWMGFRAVE
jgi:hypothetical protein